jgi:hypothetical protein
MRSALSIGPSRECTYLPPPHLRMETDPVPETLPFLAFFRAPEGGRSPKSPQSRKASYLYQELKRESSIAQPIVWSLYRLSYHGSSYQKIRTSKLLAHIMESLYLSRYICKIKNKLLQLTWKLQDLVRQMRVYDNM